MKTTYLSLLLFLSCISDTFISCVSDNMSNKPKIADIANKVADWQIDNFSYVDSGNLHDYGIDSWTNSVFYLGLAKWASVSTHGTKYYDWLYKIGEKNNWQIPSNFITYPKYGIYHADELCVAQFYIELYDIYERPLLVNAAKQRLNAIMSNPPSEDMSFRNKQSWTWCDALFMAPPVYLGIAHLENDSRYIRFMHHQFLATYEHLFDKQENLFFRDDSYFDKKEANGEKIFWGRGNGWVIAGLANIIRMLPSNSGEKSFYVDLYCKMAARLVQLQDDDGFWHASLLDPDSYPSPETSATALITYALAYGINNNILEKEQFSNALNKAWEFLLTTVNDEGKVGWVQPIGADPKAVTKDMTAVYGVGAFLMAASEVYSMEKF